MARLVGPDVEFDGASFDSPLARSGPAVRADRRRARRSRVHRRGASPPEPRCLPDERPTRRRPARRSWSTTRRGAHGARRRGRAAASTSRSSASPAVSARRRTKDLIAAALRGTRRGHGQRAQLQQRAGAAGHDPRRARRHRGAGRRDGDARVRRDHPAVRRRRARRSVSSPRSRRRTPSGSAGSTASRGPSVNWSRRCRGAGPRCSTPTTNGSSRWRDRTGATVLTFGQLGDVRISRLRARRAGAAAIHDRHAVGTRPGGSWP